MSWLVQMSSRVHQGSALAIGTSHDVLLVKNIDTDGFRVRAHTHISIDLSREIMDSTRERASSDFSMSDARSAMR